MFICPIPGADTQTVVWHALLHYGLAAIVVTVGAVFLGLALIAFRADASTTAATDALGQRTSAGPAHATKRS